MWRAVVLSAIFVSGCTASGHCYAYNCAGCCDGKDLCQQGDSVSGCGFDGVSCTACGLGQSCTTGVCNAGNCQ